MSLTSTTLYAMNDSKTVFFLQASGGTAMHSVVLTQCHETIDGTSLMRLRVQFAC